MTAKLKVVFMGTPVFAVPSLEILINANYEIAAVVTQPDRPKGRGQKIYSSPVKEIAEASNLKILQPIKVKSPDFIAQLAELAPDVIVVVAYGQLLSKELLALPRLGCINVHASLLPRYRGAAPIHWAVINGETTTGITTMHMDAGLDTGDMILKAELPIGGDDTTGQLHDRLKNLGASVLAETLSLLSAGKAPRLPQDHTMATYAPLLNRSIEKIDWSKPANTIHNLVRGLAPWPGAYCLHQGLPMKVWRTKVHEYHSVSLCPGRINAMGSEGIIVETGLGTLEIIEVQPECRRRMNARDCANGYCLTAGEILA